MGENVVVTYETLFDLLRREKTRGELQILESDFFQNVVRYLAQKKQIREQTVDEEERMNFERQLRNIKRVIKELYDTREKKIMEMALQNVRSGIEMDDVSAMLPSERLFYENLKSAISQGRSFLAKVMEGSPVKEEKIEEKVEKNIVKVKFVQKTEQFAGEDMELYGPYEKGVEENFPRPLAKMLVSRGCAEFIE